MRFPPPPFEHLLRLSDEVGVLEHAVLAAPDPAHGYCTDDVARALIVVMREPRRPQALEALAERCLAYLELAQVGDGRFHNRLSIERQWLDEVGSDDACGRALWALGVASSSASSADQRQRARQCFEEGSGFRSRWPRANAFAVLGAIELHPRRRRARELLEAALAGLGQAARDPAWPWPEKRLAYANAVLAEARLAGGFALGDERLIAEGLDLLRWLVATETRGDHFSFAPHDGWEPGAPRPAFDQQPIEAAAMADACGRAFDITGDACWSDAALRAAAWFLGANDIGTSLFDPITGGGHDGLTPHGVNGNEGAESTLALIAALQQARRLQAAARSAPSISGIPTVAAPTQRSAAP